MMKECLVSMFFPPLEKGELPYEQDRGSCRNWEILKICGHGLNLFSPLRGHRRHHHQSPGGAAPLRGTILKQLFDNQLIVKISWVIFLLTQYPQTYRKRLNTLRGSKSAF